jgi:hypothetical protein
MIFEKKYEERLAIWRSYRETLEEVSDPLQEVINLYNSAPKCSIHTDPWTPEMWPNPWELLEENQYCEFCKVLGMCYSLQLTDRFSDHDFEIHIGVDTETTDYRYLLIVDNKVINYDATKHIAVGDLPKTIKSQTVYPMPRLQ